MEGGEGEEVGGYVFADGGVGTAACFDCSGEGGVSGCEMAGVVEGGNGDSLDAFGGEGMVFCEELGVFPGEDVVGYGCYAVFVSESEAQGEH